MDTNASIGKILATLKQELKAKGLTYRDVAERLGVSHSSVKRYFSGKALTLDLLERLANLVDLDFLSLATLAHQSEQVRIGISDKQLTALKQSGTLFGIFFLLNTGWTKAQIEREIGLGTQLDKILDKLEALKLIRKLPRNGIKVLVKPDTSERGYGQVKDLALTFAHRFLLQLNLNDQNVDWRFNNVRLSKESADELKEMLTRFDDAVRALNRRDIAKPPEQTQWHQVFLGTRPISRKAILSDF